MARRPALSANPGNPACAAYTTPITHHTHTLQPPKPNCGPALPRFVGCRETKSPGFAFTYPGPKQTLVNNTSQGQGACARRQEPPWWLEVRRWICRCLCLASWFGSALEVPYVDSRFKCCRIPLLLSLVEFLALGSEALSTATPSWLDVIAALRLVDLYGLGTLVRSSGTSRNSDPDPPPSEGPRLARGIHAPFAQLT